MPALPALGALVSWIGGAGTAVASAVGATGATAAAVSAAVNSAIIGAIAGAAKASLSGEDMLQGAMQGAGVGALGGAVVGGLGAAAGTATEGVSAGVESVAADAGGVIPPTTVPGTTELPASIYGGATGSTPVAPVSSTVADAGQGVLTGASKFFDKNAGEIIGRTVAGAGEGLLKSQLGQEEISALMERDRLNRESQQIRGLAGVGKPNIPTIGGFTEKPKWQELFAAPEVKI